MAADSSGNDLTAVAVPITGLAAFAPVDAANVIAAADLGASPLVLPTGFKKLGLYKTDGGPTAAREAGDAIQFFQKGYQLAGDGTRTVQIGLAEQNAAVQQLIEGVAPDTDGVIKVSSSLPDNRFILLVVTKYKNGTEKRQIGVAAVTAVEADQSTRGSVEGQNVTFTWQEHELFNGSPFWQWGPSIPGTSAAKTVWSVAVNGSPTGGTFALIVNGSSTAPIAYNAAAADIATAINALSGVTGLSGVTVTGTTTNTVTFPSAATLSASSSLTGGTLPNVTVS